MQKYVDMCLWTELPCFYQAVGMASGSILQNLN